MSTTITHPVGFTPQMVIFDFDGTLFDTHDSISHCILLTAQTLTPQTIPDALTIRNVISTGVGLEDAFRIINNWPPSHPVPSEYVTTYRSLYAQHGIPLLKPFPNAQNLLQSLFCSQIPIVVITNKGVKSVETALQQSDMLPLVDLIVGDQPGVPRKPDPGCFNDFVLTHPKFAGEVATELSTKRDQIFVVGDTTADIKFAAEIGAKSVWARYGYGDKEHCEELKPDLAIDDLLELESYFGLTRN
ncbi:phosphoglycolate phosphatase [Cladorrhinum sp. PSN259]|nr:phosphoglycolate phosphatase [Cladorrhinum sp. PSN259]